MSKDIVCDPVEAAGSMLVTISSYKIVCTHLTKRMKGKLNTKNPYLLSLINEAILHLGFCGEKIGFLGRHTGKLSKNVTYALDTEKDQMLDIIRLLEYLVRPFEHDWVAIPQDVRIRFKDVCTALYLLSVDMYLLGETARLTIWPSTLLHGINLEITRNHIIKRRAPENRIPVWKEDNEKSPSPLPYPIPEVFSLESSSTSIFTPSTSGRCSDIGTNGQLPKISEQEQDRILKHVSIPIIDAMSPAITDRDIATLLFQWTTLDKFNGFERVSSLEQSKITKSSQVSIEEKSDNMSEHNIKHKRWKLW